MILVLLFAACSAQLPTEAEARKLLAAGGLHVQLPAGVIELSQELVVRAGTRVTGHPAGTTLRMGPAFKGGAAVAVAGPEVTIENLAIQGDRPAYRRRLPIAPYDRSFISFYDHNGISANKADGLTIRRVRLRAIPGFAIIVAASRRVALEGVQIADSGSLNPRGRNNTTGGILLEEGVAEFSVRRCELRRVRGNGIWTHSRYSSPRNGPGTMEDNLFEEIGRDAIQAGHATALTIRRNRGSRIGWPVEIVDVEGGGTPVAIDTAGNVDATTYAENRFEEINGKCIDLDGFHHGEVRKNTCTNRNPPETYPFGHYGIVFNNTNPDMRSERIVVEGNRIDGTKFGGIFLIGVHHRVTGNILTRLNLAGCNESAAKFGCLYDPAQPDLLRAGIYLGSRAERPDLASDNVISGNTISGHGMDRFCIAAAREVDLKKQVIGSNQCKAE